MSIRDVQGRLATLGFRPGPLDGVWGRQTVAALRAFQTSVGLDPDGILGPLSLQALTGGNVPTLDLFSPQLVWFQEARRLLGVLEDTGHGSNPVILDWAGALGIPYAGDDIPWCALFVGHCITATLDREAVPTHLLSARAWGQFGIPTPPLPGAVMVFWRNSPGSGLGHVGFYAGEDDRAYRILGGNQSDAVSLAWIAKDRLVGARWPATVPPPVPDAAMKVIAGRGEPLSTKES